MSVKRMGIGGFILAIAIGLLAPATASFAGCYINEGGGTSCYPTSIGGTVDRSTTTVFTSTDYNFGVPTTVSVTFPPSGTGTFTFSGSLNPASFCILVLPCHGSTANLGTITSGFSSANPVIVTFDTTDPSITLPPLVPGWYVKGALPALPELPCLLTSLLPVPCSVSQKLVGGHLISVDRLVSGDPILGH